MNQLDWVVYCDYHETHLKDTKVKIESYYVFFLTNFEKYHGEVMN